MKDSVCHFVNRSARGSAIAEFGAAFWVLVLCFFIPLINLSFIAVRYLIANAVVNEYVHRLALSENRSSVYSSLGSDNRWSSFASGCGINIAEKNVHLVVCGGPDNSEKVVVEQGTDIPAAFLPGGAKAPCLYTVEMSVKADINPVYAGGTGIPGITAPVRMNLVGRSAWENLSKNPISKRYFINE